MNGSQSSALFVISVAAEMAGMHPQTLRIYERKGLITPYRTPGGTRRYSQSDIQRLILIQELTTRGLNLEGVRQVLDLKRQLELMHDEIESLREEVRSQQREAERRISEVHRSYRRELVLRSQMTPEPRRRAGR